MKEKSSEIIINGAVLAGGKIEETLAEYSEAPIKALIEIGGKPMIEYVIEAAKNVREINRWALSAPLDLLPSAVKEYFDVTAESGKTIMDSLRSAANALNPPPNYILVLASDMPLITGEAINDFVAKSLLADADITYAYLEKKDSEAKYPDAHHTYVKTADGTFCGTGLFFIKPNIIEACEKFFLMMTENRKNPLGLAKILGSAIILKYMTGTITVADLEERISKIIGCKARGVRTNFAEAAFNVDAPEELVIAHRTIENS